MPGTGLAFYKHCLVRSSHKPFEAWSTTVHLQRGPETEIEALPVVVCRPTVTKYHRPGDFTDTYFLTVLKAAS